MTRQNKIISLIVCVVILLSAFPVSGKEKYAIAYIPGKKNAFYQSVEKGIRAKASEYKIKVIVPQYPESWDANEQISLIRSVFTNDRPRLILISPASSTNLSNVLLDLHKQGIGIITIDRTLENLESYVKQSLWFPLLQISTDQWQGGQSMANYLANLIDGKGKVYINSTFPDIPSISRRFKAFLKTLDTFPNINIIGIDIAGIDFSNSDKGVVGSTGELERNAFKQSLEIIQKHPDINAIFCTNHLSGKGIAKTIQLSGLEGSIKIGVWDTTVEMVQAIDAGIVDLALAQNPKAMGVEAVYWGNRYLETKESIPGKLSIDFQLVNKTNSSDPVIRELIYR